MIVLTEKHLMSNDEGVKSVKNCKLMFGCIQMLKLHDYIYDIIANHYEFCHIAIYFQKRPL